MTDLYIVLFALAALIIVIVLVTNWWQERKYRLTIEQNFAAKPDDALLPENQQMSDKPSSDDEAIKTELDREAYADDVFTDQNIAIDVTESHELNAFSRTHNDFEHDHSVDASFKDDSLTTQKVDFERIEPQFGEHDASFDISNTIEDLDDANPLISKLKVDEPKVSDGPFIEPDAIAPEAHQVAFDNAPDLESPYVLDDYVNTSDLVETDEAPSLATQNHTTQNEINDSSLSLDVTLPKELHGQIDLIALLYLVSEMPLGELKPHFNSFLNTFDKPTSIFLLNENNAWLTLTATEALSSGLNTPVSRICCSMQLADRAGAASSSALQSFQADVDDLGLVLNAQLVWQNALDALSIANTLDAFCAEVDQTVRFHLKHGDNGAFTGTKLRGLAEAQGFVIAENGAFKFFDATSNRLLFSMVNFDSHPFNLNMLRSSVVKGVTFELDIPHVKNCTEVFSQMVQVARQMEMGLNAVLVDDNKKILGEVQVEKIRQQLKVIHAKMLVKGIVPGSDEASRLFV